MYKISGSCKKCGLCFKKCPSAAIVGETGRFFCIISEKCRRCGVCYQACPFEAILKEGKPRPKEDKKKVLKARIDSKNCVGCRNCFLNCPNRVIKYEKGFFSTGHCHVDETKCKGCGSCVKMCLNDCIEIISK